MIETYMTALDIAAELNVSARQARGIILANIPHVRIGRNEYRVKRSDFQEALLLLIVHKHPFY